MSQRANDETVGKLITPQIESSLDEQSETIENCKNILYVWNT